MVDSRQRDSALYTSASDYSVVLPTPLRNVRAVSLVSYYIQTPGSNLADLGFASETELPYLILEAGSLGRATFGTPADYGSGGFVATTTNVLATIPILDTSAASLVSDEKYSPAVHEHAVPLDIVRNISIKFTTPNGTAVTFGSGKEHLLVLRFLCSNTA